VATALKRVVVIGVGLIGGSFALALKQRGVVGEVVGVGRSAAVLARAAALGIIDGAASLEAAVAGADLILIATPVAQTAAILTALAPLLQPGMVVTDAGSTKCDVVAAARIALGAKIGQFVPGHPIAGSEANGPEAALAGLYAGKKVVLTPLPENAPETLEKVTQAWQLCGAVVHCLAPAQHDQVFAAVSHLPHLLAFALVDQVDHATEAQLLFEYAASGFRDFTRIAGSSPEMWRDIALANREALLAQLATYGTQLAKLTAMLAAGDGDGLQAVFANARRARHAWQATIETAPLQNRRTGDT
jgi:prephenate dehydrogenase